MSYRLKSLRRLPRGSTPVRFQSGNSRDFAYRLGLAPWERREVAESWRRMLDGPEAPGPGRAPDVGCGSGRDAVFLAKRGWRVTAVDLVEKALAAAERRAAEEGVEVEWLRGTWLSWVDSA